MVRIGLIIAALVVLAGARGRAADPRAPSSDPCQRARETLGADVVGQAMTPADCQQALDSAEEERWQLWLDSAAADEQVGDRERAALGLARFVEAVERRTSRVPGQWVDMRERARATIARLDRELLGTRARVRIDSHPSGAAVTLAPEVAASVPERAPRTPITAYFAPGEHRVQLLDRARDRPREVTFTVTAGRVIDLHVDLSGEAPPGAALHEKPGQPVLGRSSAVDPDAPVNADVDAEAPPVTPVDALGHDDEAPPIRTPGSPLLATLGTAAVAAGAASLAVGVVFAVVGAGLDDEAACSGAACERHQKLRAEVREDADVSWSRATGALIVGGALVAGGVIALLLDDDAPAPTVGPWLAPDGGGLRGAVRF